MNSFPRMVLVIGIVVIGALGGCGGKKKSGPERRKTAAPKPAPSDASKRIVEQVGHTATEKERERAVTAFVRGWPKTRAALPAVLKLLQWDKENRGAYAMSLARIGKPLVAPLNRMVAAAPGHRPTLRAAGALAYHLVLRDGLTQRSDAEFAELRRALKPSFGPLWAAFLAEPTHEEEIYLGVAACAEEALKRFRPPFPKGGLSRVAYVLYLVLGSGQNQKLLPAADRRRYRKRAAPLAAIFARALAKARPDGTGESPNHLMLGLAVLGRASAAAVAAEPLLAGAARCPLVLKVLGNVAEQAPLAAVAPARARLTRCTVKASAPAIRSRAKALLSRLGPQKRGAYADKP